MDPSAYLILSLMKNERSLKFWEAKVLDAAESPHWNIKKSSTI